MKKLNLGCGKYPIKGFINCDIRKLQGVDKVFDLEKFPYPFESNSIDFIYMHSSFEHILFPERALNEMYRICKKDTIIHLNVPYYNCAGSFNDLTHYHYFNKRTFFRFCEQDTRFEVIDIKLNPMFYAKYLPFKELFSFFIGNIIRDMDVKLKIKR